MLSHLSYDGTAAFLLANGALNAGVEGEAEYEIRKKLIQDNKVEAIIVLPRDMFYATDISVTLWLCGNHKKLRKSGATAQKSCCETVKMKSYLLMPELWVTVVTMMMVIPC